MSSENVSGQLSGGVARPRDGYLLPRQERPLGLAPTLGLHGKFQEAMV